MQATDANTPPLSKRLFLIRHAESINNVDKREAAQTWRQLFLNPSRTGWARIGRLIKVPMDSDLSPAGER